MLSAHACPSMSTNSQPLISIGLPVWNGANFLDQAIQSVLAQTEPDLELIISDNASTDVTEEICRGWLGRDDRVRYFRFSENQGASANHSKVVELARGTYFRWQAHDDLCHPDLVRRCIAEHRSSPHPLALVHPTAELIDDAGRVLGLDPTRLCTAAARPARRVWDCLMQVRYGTPMYGVAELNTLRRTRLFDRFVSSDYVLFLEFALLGEIRQLPDVLCQRRFHASRSMTAQKSSGALFSWYGGAGSAPATTKDVRRRLLREYLASIKRLTNGRLERIECSASAISSVYWRRTRNWLGLFRRRFVPIEN